MVTKTNNRMIDGAAVNVRDFGAVGDGVTGDTAAFLGAQATLAVGEAALVPLTGNAYLLDGTDDLSTMKTYSFGAVTFDTSSGSVAPTHTNLLP